MKFIGNILFAFLFCLCTFGAQGLRAQQTQHNMGSYSLKIPNVAAMAGSPAHLYVFSKTDGLIVFRSLKNSLQWLYTASKVKPRGKSIRADVRFAYLYGDSLNLAVVDPTKFYGDGLPSVKLSAIPYDAVRWKDHLYIALGTEGLGRINLSNMPDLNSNVQIIKPGLFKNQSITGIEASDEQIFVLSNRHKLFIFAKAKRVIRFERKRSISHRISRIFEVNGTLLGSNKTGAIFRIQPNKSLQNIGYIGEAVMQIKSWKNRLIIKGKSNRLWILTKRGKLRLWKADKNAENYFAISRGQLWLCQYDHIRKVNKRELQNFVKPGATTRRFFTFGGVLRLQPIQNQVVPFSHALLVTIKLKTFLPVSDIQLHLKTSAKHAKIMGQTLYWKPNYNDVNKHYWFKVIAKTNKGEKASTRFKVTVEPYNTPPRFVPVRTITIPAGNWYYLDIEAKDPDGNNKHLIRYLGVNLPNGATLNAKTGVFRWRPGKYQTGKYKFRIIATDQYGAASYEDVTIKVHKPDSE